MIFDDYDSSTSTLNDKENSMKNINKKQSKKIKIKTSLDDILEDKKNPTKKKVLTNVYCTFKLAINKNFFKQNQNPLNSPSIESLSNTSDFEKNSNNQSSYNEENSLISSKNDLYSYSLNSKTGKDNDSEKIQKNQEEINEDKKRSDFNKKWKTVNSLIMIPTSKVEMNKVYPNSYCNIKNVELSKNADQISHSFKFKNTKINDNEFIEKEKCLFCKGDFRVNDTLAKINSCGHIFHKLCFDNWINQHSKNINIKCPYCNCYV